jgi:hypothetical protein
MAKIMRIYGETYYGIIRLPTEVTFELLDALGSAGTASTALAFGKRWLAYSLRLGENMVTFDCHGVRTIASLKEDADGWHVLMEVC